MNETSDPRSWRHLPSWLTQLFIGTFFLRLGSAFFLRCRVRRARSFPRGRAYVLACNHRSFADPPLVGMAQYAPVAYFARSSLWKSRFVSFFLGLMYGIPVERDNPMLSSMKGAVARLKQGIPILVFPEGTRTSTGRLGKLREGPVLFARRAGVPIVPVYIYRSDRLIPRSAVVPDLTARDLEIRFGSPIEPPPGMPVKEADRWMRYRLEAWMRLQERKLLG
jgi:1-acyl-sn-glycerol-3-phosphate acyltransferase